MTIHFLTPSQVKSDSVWTAKKEKYYDDEQLYISFTIFGNGMEMLARSPKGDECRRCVGRVGGWQVASQDVQEVN